jgi:ubiquinone/menaquinone biosynthesis C-methylase UbiE
MTRRLKPGIQVMQKKGLYYTLDSDKRPVQFKPWLGDSFSFLYDFIMRKSVFPKKFGGDMQKHYQALTQELAGAHKKQVLELGTGSGSAVHFLPPDNQYTGSDISAGLLKQAVKRFEEAGFPEPEFYVVSADDLPFDDHTIELCLCILSLNFFPDAEKVFQEVERVLVTEGVFLCSVPVPERNELQSTINGTLYSESELEKICCEHGLNYQPIPCENGALLYFRAIKAGD